MYACLKLTACFIPSFLFLVCVLRSDGSFAQWIFRLHDVPTQQFLTVHEDELRALPVPEIARKYYEDEFRRNPNFFKAFCAVSKSPMESHDHSQTSGSSPRRENRPHELHSLYDVFLNVRDDEKEHWMALCNLVQYDDMAAVDEASIKSTGTRGRYH
jgi:hypothetical protein